MNALTPIVAIDPALSGVGIWPVPDAPSEQSARQDLAYARLYRPQAQRAYDEAIAGLRLAQSNSDPFVRADAVRRVTVDLRQCAGVLAETAKWVARAERALAGVLAV